MIQEAEVAETPSEIRRRYQDFSLVLFKVTHFLITSTKKNYELLHFIYKQP